MARNSKKGKPPKGYDSWFEYELHIGVLKPCKYHTGLVHYTQEKIYEPDFVVGDFLIEAKGRFRDSEEARKYVDIRNSLIHEELVFVFYEPNTPMPRARRRKDGTKFTMAEWANKNGFRFYTVKTVTALLKEAEIC